MITYIYRCSECGEEFEVQFDGMVGVSVPDISPVYCPKCNGDLTYRIIKSANFILKGDGWSKNTKETYGE